MNYGSRTMQAMRESGMLKTIDITDTAVLAVLSTYTNKDGICWPSINTVAGDLGVSRSTVDRSYKRLIKRGILTRKGGTKVLMNDPGISTSANPAEPTTLAPVPNNLSTSAKPDGDAPIATVPKGYSTSAKGGIAPVLRGYSTSAKQTLQEHSNEHNNEHFSASHEKATDKQIPVRSSLSMPSRPPSAPPTSPRVEADAMAEALKDACYPKAEPTKSEWGKIHAAGKILRDDGVGPDEVIKLAKAYRQMWPNVTLTPTAIAKHVTTIRQHLAESTQVSGTANDQAAADLIGPNPTHDEVMALLNRTEDQTP